MSNYGKVAIFHPPPALDLFEVAKTICLSSLKETCMCCARPSESAMHRLDGLPVCEVCAGTMREAITARRVELQTAKLERTAQ